jgi:hypothetical protein
MQTNNKLTEEHFYLDNSAKMRNKLALQVLDKEMLELMKNYRSATNRNDLDATIEFLSQTSLLVEIYTSNRRIRTLSDERLCTIQNVLKWWREWHGQDNCNSKTNYITKECHEDLLSMLIGFCRLCQNKLTYSPLGSICPSRISSDLVENFFCCQRSLNGSTSNPTYLQFCKSVNTLVITQNSLTKKGNSSTAVSVGGAKPFKCHVNKSFRGLRL